MIEIQMKELQRCITFIKATKCQFKIITPDGEEFGELQVEKKKPRKERVHPHGSISNWYRPFINLDLQVGDVMTIPLGEFKPKEIQSGVVSILVRAWGKKTFSTITTETELQILRTANLQEQK